MLACFIMNFFKEIRNSRRRIARKSIRTRKRRKESRGIEERRKGWEKMERRKK